MPIRVPLMRMSSGAKNSKYVSRSITASLLVSCGYCTTRMRFRVIDSQPCDSQSAPSYRSADLRDRLERLVIADLLGPAGGSDEIVAEPTVRGRYLVGMLAPRGSSGIPEEYDDADLGGTDSEDGITDAP